MGTKVTALGAAEFRPRGVAIGAFDGIHLGHRAVIDGADTVVTFDPHPRAVLRPDESPGLISPISVRRDLLDDLGVAELVVIPFDEALSRLSPDEFIDEVLIERLGVRSVAVGENFRFGAKGKGSPGLLANRPEFETRIVPLVEIDGAVLSSTRIRERIANGEVALARRWLGAPFTVEGTIVEGLRCERHLGVPNATLVPDDRFVVPGRGSYAAWANGGPAVVDVGYRTTLESKPRELIDVHFIDRAEDFRSETLRVAFVQELPTEGRFESAEDLIKQTRQEVERAGPGGAASASRHSVKHSGEESPLSPLTRRDRIAA
jgi:riboflavin kinase / FMN adenylyltransferase